MSHSLSVLIVEDREHDAALLTRELRRAGHDLLHELVDNEAAMIAALGRRSWDIVIADYSMPGFDALAALAVVDRFAPDVPVVVASGSVGEETAAEVMRAGARDLVLKHNLKRLPLVVARELDAARTRRAKKTADARLDRERELLHQLMQGIPDAISFKDRERRYIRLNDVERDVLSIPSGVDVIGATSDAFVPPELAASRRVDEERVLSSGEPLVDCVDRIVRPDGSIRWLSATKAPIHDTEGNVAGLVEIARDITESKRQEQLKNEFIATVSHELRTPLTSIQGALGVLASGPADPLPDRVKRMIAIALDNCRRLVRIVNDILDIERMESGLMTLVRKPVELRGLIAQAVQASQSAAEDHHVAIRIESPRDPITIMTDPDRLAQVLANLLSNAIKFSPPDGEVVVGVEQADQCARIHVRDHGPGIPQEYRHRIFDKFVQVDATDQRRRGGTGLGLSIARQIVLQLNGTIDFETGTGCGTTFTVALPAIAHTAASEIAPRVPAHEFVSDPAP